MNEKRDPLLEHPASSFLPQQNLEDREGPKYVSSPMSHSEDKHYHDREKTYYRDESYRHNSKRAMENWARLQKHVRGGEFLLLMGGGAGGHSSSLHLLPQHKDQKKARAAFLKDLNFSLTQCLVALGLHILVAIIAFSFIFEGWTVIDSIYFAVTTFFTIGFGDLYPQSSQIAKMFTCFYALAGVTCLGIAIGVVGSNMVETEERAIQDASQAAKNRAMALFSTEAPQFEVKGGNVSIRDASAKRRWFGINCLPAPFQCMRTPSQCNKWLHGPGRGAYRFLASSVIVVAVLFAFGVVVAQDPAIDSSEVFYFLLITSTTCGFGDIAPVSQESRLATALFIPFAVGAMGHWMAIVARFIIETRQIAFRRNLETRGLTMADLEAMDDNGDGNVTLVEYLEFMLIAMNKVDRALIDDLRQNFAFLDVDGTGVLSKEDLIEAARRKLKHTSRKLELAQYKKDLVRKAEASRAAKDRDFWHRRAGMSLFDIFKSGSLDEHKETELV